MAILTSSAKVTDLFCCLPLFTMFYQLEVVHLGDPTFGYILKCHFCPPLFILGSWIFHSNQIQLDRFPKLMAILFYILLLFQFFCA